MISNGRYIPGSSYAEKLNYYRKNSPAMSVASEYGLSHIGWNHDSKDSTNKFGKENKEEYIDHQLESICNRSQKNIMTLFHDTSVINSLPSKYNLDKTVMDEIIEKLKCLGVNILAMDDFCKVRLTNCYIY